MANQNRTLEIDVKLDNRQLKREAKETKKSLGGIAKTARTLGPLIAAAFGTAVVKKSVDAFIRQENAIKQLENRIKSTGGAAGVTADQMINLAAGLQQVTTYGDEAIIEMQSLLLTFTKIGGDVLPDTTEAVLNVATAMGTDLKSAAVQIGKALNDPILGLSALARSGIQFSDAQKEVIKNLVETGRTADAQKIILKELEVQFGGSARAAKDTLGGALTSAGNQLGDLGEIIGGTFAPTLKLLARDVGNLAVRLSNLLNPTDVSKLADMNTRLVQLRDELRGQAKFGTAVQWIYGNRDEMLAEAAQLEADITALNTKINAAAGVNPQAGESTKVTAAEIEAERLKSIELSKAKVLTDSFLTYQYGLTEANKRGAEARAQIKADELAVEEAGMNALANLSTLANTNSRKAFEVAKIASIATTTIKTFEGAQSAYAAGAKINPYVGAAFAAAAVAAGLANIQKVSQTSFDGGGSGGGARAPQFPSGGAGGDPFGQAPIAQPGQDVAQISATQIQVISGNTLIGKIVEEEVIPAINEALRRGQSLDLEFN